jgi:prepilin peptidase CpaA
VSIVAICGVCLTLAFRQEQIVPGFIIAASTLVGLGMLANLGLIGGGDVKIIAASTLLFPPASTGLLLVSITLAGGMLSIVYLAARVMVRNRVRQMVPSTHLVERGDPSPRWLSEECSRIAAGGPMPYAFAILGGVVTTKAAGVYTCLHANYCWV